MRTHLTTVYDLNTHPLFEGTPAHARLLEWMRGENIDAARVLRLEVHGGDHRPYAVITEMELDDNGHDQTGPDGELLTRTRRVSVSALPPGAQL